MTDILDEVLDSIKLEKKQKYLKISIITLSITCLLAIIIVSFFSYKNYSRQNIIKNEANLFHKLTASGINNLIDNQEATKALESQFQSNKSIYSGMAGFYLAKISLLKGNHAKAVYYYDLISKNNSLPDFMKNYSLLLSLNMKLLYNLIELKEIKDIQVKTNTPFEQVIKIIRGAALVNRGDNDVKKDLENILTRSSNSELVNNVINNIIYYFNFNKTTSNT